MEALEELKLLGRGAMGSVHLMRRPDGAQFALKKIAIPTREDREVALQEVTIMQRLQHPHIVSFLEASVQHATGELHILMEFCPKGDLGALLERQRRASKRLAEADACSMLRQLTSALAYVHARRVVHRDIKSPNVFVCDAEPGHVFVKLGDFGVAKALESTKALACTQCGTPYYLPPEVCSGTPYDAKADVWSLGVLAYEMLALRYPFRAATLPALVMQIVGGKYSPLPSAYSGELRTLVGSLLRQLPRDRPAADQLLRHRLLRPPPGTAAAEPPPSVTVAAPPAAGPSSSTMEVSSQAGDFAPPPAEPAAAQRLRRMRGAYGADARARPAKKRKDHQGRQVHGQPPAAAAAAAAPKPALHPAYRPPRAPTPPPPTPPPPVATPPSAACSAAATSP